jgi:hypothetical protein
MARRLLLLGLGGVAAAGLGWARRRADVRRAARNGGRDRTERLRRQIEEARERLREDIARARERRS